MYTNTEAIDDYNDNDLLYQKDLWSCPSAKFSVRLSLDIALQELHSYFSRAE